MDNEIIELEKELEACSELVCTVRCYKCEAVCAWNKYDSPAFHGLGMCAFDCDYYKTLLCVDCAHEYEHKDEKWVCNECIDKGPV